MEEYKKFLMFENNVQTYSIIESFKKKIFYSGKDINLVLMAEI